jgi:drug/metabolite transporter (DMT)-like permease
MRLALLTTLTMIAFAANSLLNRQAVGTGGMDPSSFALIRVVAGAAVLATLASLRAGPRSTASSAGVVSGVVGLTLYLAGFSLAYISLDAGTGALILFGTVQITMFTGAALRGQALSAARAAGAALAFAGLLILLWPGDTPVAVWPVLAMVSAGLGWGIYSLAGSGVANPLGRTALNFAFATPLIALLWWAMGAAVLTGPGLWLAVVSGAVTSGLGYALWYAILPALGAQRAAVAQLTVPVIAALGGAVLLGETLGLRFAVACAFVLGGVALAALTKPKR